MKLQQSRLSRPFPKSCDIQETKYSGLQTPV